MEFDIEVLLRGRAGVVVNSVTYDTDEASSWTDDDVRNILTLTLLEFDKVQNPNAEERVILLQGLSWIVTPVDGGVAIAIEIKSGTVVAGPFTVEEDQLTQAIGRVLAHPSGSSSQVH